MANVPPETSAGDRASALGAVQAPPVVLQSPASSTATPSTLPQLLRLKNGGESPEAVVNQLNGFLTTLANSIPSFQALDMDADLIQPVALKLASYKIEDLKTLLQDDKVLRGASPQWVVTDHPLQRELAVYFREYLVKKRDHIISEDAGPHHAQSQQDHPLSRSSKKKRKRSASSSSSTSQRRDKVDQVTQHLSGSDFKVFGASSFPESKLVLKVFKYRQKNSSTVAFLASSPLEEWTPSYVGQELSSSARKALRNERLKTDSLTMAQAMENIIAFWITHGLAGFVSKEAVLKNILINIRIASEKSVKWLIQYFRILTTHIRNAITEQAISNFDKYLNCIIPEVESSVNMYFSRQASRPSGPNIGAGNFNNNSNINKGKSKGNHKTQSVVLKPNASTPPNKVIGKIPNNQNSQTNTSICR